MFIKKNGDKKIVKQKGFNLPKELEIPLDNYLDTVSQSFSDYVRELIRKDLINKKLITIGGNKQ